MNDHEYIIGLMKEATAVEPCPISYIPAPTVQRYYLARGLYVVQHDVRGRPVGYILHGPIRGNRNVSITHAVIDYSLQNRGFGSLAFEVVLRRAQKARAREIVLSCAEDLSANMFWQSQGFVLVNTIRRQNKRKRLIHRYAYSILPRLIGDDNA